MGGVTMLGAADEITDMDGDIKFLCWVTLLVGICSFPNTREERIPDIAARLGMISLLLIAVYFLSRLEHFAACSVDHSSEPIPACIVLNLSSCDKETGGWVKKITQSSLAVLHPHYVPCPSNGVDAIDSGDDDNHEWCFPVKPETIQLWDNRTLTSPYDQCMDTWAFFVGFMLANYVVITGMIQVSNDVDRDIEALHRATPSTP